MERVLPAASYRQWVLTVPFPLRLRIARDPGELSRVLNLFHRALTGAQRVDLRRFWHAVRKSTKVEHIRFHDLRHTAASEMLHRGLLLREVQYVLGHSSARMTGRYAHFAPTFRPPRAIEWNTPVAGIRTESR